MIRKHGLIAALFLMTLLHCGGMAAADGETVRVYFGTYTRGASEGIYVSELDLATGRLGPITLAAETANPSFLAIHPDRPLIYAVGELGTFQGKKTGAVSAFSIDPTTGKLTLLNQQSSEGTGPCHVSVDRTGRNVLVANYGGGSIACLPIGNDGRLGKATSSFQHEGSSVNPRRQQGPHAHSINLDAANRFALVADLGLDKILVYRFDASEGELTPNDPPSTELKPGAGPRHFAFHPTGRYAYVINELHSTVTAMRYDADRGTLSPMQTISTLPEGFDGQNSTAEVQVHPSGKFLYGSNRGHDSIACFAIDEATGRLTWLGSESTQGKTPRNFGIDPTGKYLLAANQNTDNVVVFRIDTSTGRLSPTGQSLTVGMPVCVKFCAIAGAAETPTATWSNWRGPDQVGSVDSGPLPVEWTADTNLAWKVALPGRGCSTPIVWGDHIIVTVPIDDRDGVISLDLAGKTRWQTMFDAQNKGKHANASGCNPSPVTDGEFLFVYYKTGTLACLDFSGKILWQMNLQERFGKTRLFWDVGTSPVLTRRHVVMAVMHAGESFLAAFDKPTGKLAWKVARQYDCPIEGDQSYTTPIVMQQNDSQSILVWGAEHVTCHRADDGKAIWSCGGFNPDAKKLWVSVASAVVAGNTAVVPYGRGTHLSGVRLGGSGDVTETHRPWIRDDIGAFVPTPAAYDGKVYLLGDTGEITCLDPATGKTLWSGALPKHRKKYYASPTVADGKLYAAREDGTVFVAQVIGPFKVLSENPMEEQIIATPVPIAGGLLLRGERHLFCVRTP